MLRWWAYAGSGPGRRQTLTTTERGNRPTGTGLMRMRLAGEHVEPLDCLENGSPPTAAAEALSSATEVRTNA